MKNKVAILTNFLEFNPGYSLSGIVLDQARMLSKHGHDVTVFADERFSGTAPDNSLASFAPEVPHGDLVDYRSMEDISEEHKALVGRLESFFTAKLQGFDIIFTHDWIFTGWNLPYALAMQSASSHMRDPRWLHWIHSIPTHNFDWWNIRKYGPFHKIVYPNQSDSLLVAEQYKGSPDHIRVIPHIKDMRTWWDYSDETCRFIDLYPTILSSDILQILPASVDRLEAKRVREVILIFSKLKKFGHKVCLVIANQWATTRGHKQSIENYKKIAKRNGLETRGEGAEVIFTSDFGKEYEVGIPKTMIRELFQLSNLFIFPTREESFGLVVPEAALSGCFLVLNKSLDNQLEVSGYTSLYFDFGSFRRQHNVSDENRYHQDIAFLIKGRMLLNEVVRAKTFSKTHYNMDALYMSHYRPIMEESEVW